MDKELIVENDSVAIYSVPGGYVRTNVDINFIGGGHDRVYDSIPEKQIWIDNELEPKEQLYTMIHELTERRGMQQGMSYDDAHEEANKVEKHYRDTVDDIDDLAGLVLMEMDKSGSGFRSLEAALNLLYSA